MREPGVLTKYLAEKGRGLIKLEPEVSDNEDQGYLAFDDGGVEVEVGELLYGLIRILKPKEVLTTGIYSGISDMYIGQALEDNQSGISTALEFEQYHINRALELWTRTGVAHRIFPIHTSSLDYVPDRQYQFILLDTEPGIRFQELEKFYPFLDEGGYLAIHDLPPTFCQGNINPDHPEIKSYPFGDVPEMMQELMKSGKLVKVQLSSPRGFALFYKPRERDYKP